MEPQGLERLKAKLALKNVRSNMRYDIYEMKNDVPALLSNSPYMPKSSKACLGWCAKAVDSLADRLIFKGFKNDFLNVGEIFDQNNPDILFDSAILSALITGCSFIAIRPEGEEKIPKLTVVDGRHATGTIDPTTNLLIDGYAILETDSYGNPTLEAYYTPEYTEFFEKGESGPTVYANKKVGVPLLVPVIYRPDAKRPFGHSRISRSNIKLLESACRTVFRSEVAAEFYSFPQKYVTGLAPEAEMMDKWKATVSTLLVFEKDEDGDRPQLGQFQTQSMAPFTEQLRALAALFAGENGLTLDDLGFVSDNPSSAEAIKASHETLRLTARKAQRTFGSCFLNVGYVAACLRDDFQYSRTNITNIKPVWEPIFEPDAAMLSSIGDGAIKLNQAVPGYFGKDNLEDMTGVKASQEQVDKSVFNEDELQEEEPSGADEE